MADKKETNSDFRHLVRVASTDLLGEKSILFGLTKIKGVGVIYANAILSVSGIPKGKQTGIISDTEVDKLNDILANPEKYKLPVWLFNRRKDYETGEDTHLMSSDLDFTRDNDLKRLKKTKALRGMRHAWGLPVRGQRTKSNFRRSKGKVTGVKRKK